MIGQKAMNKRKIRVNVLAVKGEIRWKRLWILIDLHIHILLSPCSVFWLPGAKHNPIHTMLIQIGDIRLSLECLPLLNPSLCDRNIGGYRLSGHLQIVVCFIY